MNLLALRPTPPTLRPSKIRHAGSAELPSVVVTSLRMKAKIKDAWNRLIFYEQLRERPPLLLRTLLPEPLRTMGSKSKVGDEALCLYRQGFLLKRVTRVDPESRYEFVVAEQNLRFGGGLTLEGGSYALEQRGYGWTEVTLTTRYRCPRRPRWLWGPLEALACHAFHRHILQSIRQGLESESSPQALETPDPGCSAR